MISLYLTFVMLVESHQTPFKKSSNFTCFFYFALQGAIKMKHCVLSKLQ